MRKINEDIIQYSFRLNLENEYHLKIHQMLQRVNLKIYRSKNNYIVQSLLAGMLPTEHEITEETSTQEYVTKEQLEEVKVQVTNNIMKELTRLILGATIQGVWKGTMESSDNHLEKEQEQVEALEDDVLNELSDMWSS